MGAYLKVSARAMHSFPRVYPRIQPLLLLELRSKDSLKAHGRINLTVWPAKNGAPVGFRIKIVPANGKELALDQKPS